MRIVRCLAVLSGATMLIGAQPAAPPPAPNQIGCASPVGRNDSAAMLQRKFGANARKEMVPGAEGEELNGLVLYPRDPRRRIEVMYPDEKMLAPASVTVRASGSSWTVAGLRIGDGIDQVTTRNGRGFALYGFEWDYGGYVNDLKGGALTRLPGGCNLTLRFSLPENLTTTPRSIMGDVKLQSSNPALRRARPVIAELALNWR